MARRCRTAWAADGAAVDAAAILVAKNIMSTLGSVGGFDSRGKIPKFRRTLL